MLYNHAQNGTTNTHRLYPYHESRLSRGCGPFNKSRGFFAFTPILICTVFFPRWGLGIFLFTTASRTALGPTQPPILWVPVTLSLGVKRPDREADHSPPSSSGVKECVELYVHSPRTPSWYGAQKRAQGQPHITFCE
jgi:hypothetical protein